jgi:hypothetical protein
MPDFLDASLGERLPLTSYLEDFDNRFQAIRDNDSWKLERQQHFAQPGHPGWEAFARGEWKESMRLNTVNRANMEEHYRKAAEKGFHFFRVRVAEKPVIPYLQWELHVLLQRDESGEHIRVVGPDAVGPYESTGRLPELLTIGESALYHIIYDDRDELTGAVIITDTEIVRECREFIKSFYEAAESVSEFFNREIAHLAPPSGE